MEQLLETSELETKLCHRFAIKIKLKNKSSLLLLLEILDNMVITIVC